MNKFLETVSDEQDAPIRIFLPFKDQKSANAARHQLGDLSRKIDAVVHPVYTSQKIKGQFKPKEHKPLIVNQQKRCLLLQVWSVRCRLGWLHESTSTSTCGGT